MIPKHLWSIYAHEYNILKSFEYHIKNDGTETIVYA